LFKDETQRYMMCEDVELDVEVTDVLTWPRPKRRRYILQLLTALDDLIRNSKYMVTLRKAVTLDEFKRAMDALWNEPANPERNRFLRTADDGKRNVLMPKSPAHSQHMVFAEHAMWRMITKHGDWQSDVRLAVSDANKRKALFAKASSLPGRLDALLDPTNKSKERYRLGHDRVLPMIYSYTQTQYNIRSAFPPFHAKFLAEIYLPRDRASIVVDPCAGWGGRLIGTMLVNRGTPVKYRGVDPNPEMRQAYSQAQAWSVFNVVERIYNHGVSDEALELTMSAEPPDADDPKSEVQFVVGDDSTYWLRRTAVRARRARVDQARFEEWIHTDIAKPFYGNVDLVFTSPPYFNAEIYHSSETQSANAYSQYEQWREHFYRPLITGAFNLLRLNGVFVLNVANVEDAPRLEQDAMAIAAECGFHHETDFRLAMPIAPGTRKRTNKRGRDRPLHTLTLGGKPYKYEPVFVFRKPASTHHGKNGR